MTAPELLARQALAGTTPAAGEAIEIYISTATKRRYEMTAGQLENIESRQTFGAAVRVLTGGRLGFAYRADARPEALTAAIAEARDLAQRTAEDPARELPPRRDPARVNVPASKDLQALPLEQKLELVRRLETAALAADPRVRVAHQAAYQEEDIHVALVSTLGVDMTWSFQEFGLSVAAVAEDDGDSQIGEDYRVWRLWDDLDPETVGREAGEKAAHLLKAAPLPTARRSLLIPPAIGTGLFEMALSAWSAESVQRGRSYLAGREGQAIAAAAVTLLDDGTAPGGVATAPVDDEGTPTQRTELIRNGHLAGFMHNQETARRAQVASTGNAYRASLQTPPSVGPTNVICLPGTFTESQLLARAEGGLYLAEVLGLHTLDPVTGAFSLGASGWLIENGTLGRPVRGVTMAGQLETLLKQVEALGDQLTTYGRFSAPALLVRDIMVAGM